ncbi:ATP-binding cassette domain-containing protein [Microbacterium sp. MEC084]|jgi:ABC-2 type transport system ATP-binding protein|uniref:ABC transporter ATP-binding protein n=1 Tax=unclassified Microbacterium TaxID=2609290 RepID=UPI0006F6F94B|nr:MULTISPECIES: ABC transporter ATP-binding protein [unclassified Microbacterium]KQZ05166.1 ABC transporter ATP-binding protein [Microbacterium sp. Root53]MCD1268539.1 ATP-binding cassette domain-containing protein [Microbacterium sp. MEC084]
MRATAPVHTPSIIVDGVRKTFMLNHAHSLKDTVVSWIRGRKLSTQFHALNGLDLVVNEGDSIAILGYNGSGKSTLLKLLSGVMQPDGGHVLTRGRVAGLIEVGAGFHPELSGRENVFLNAAILGMQQKEIEARYDEIVAFAEIGQFIDQEVKHYSSGMFMRLAFSVAIHVDVDVLLVDEILSVGDAPFREKCRAKFEELIAAGKTLVIVSHDMEMVRELCNRAVVIRKGELVFDGDVDDAIRAMGE